MNIPSKLPIGMLCSTLLLLLLLQGQVDIVVNAQAVSAASNYFPGASNRDVYTNWLSSVSYNKSTFIESPFDTTIGAAIHWNIDNDMIHLAVAVTQATGWASFGLAEAGAMRGADIVLYTAATDSVSDSYVLGDPVTPFEDTCQSWELTNSVVDSGFIIFEAKRLLNTSDSQDRVIIDDSYSIIPPTRVIAAWGNSTEPTFHGRSVSRGSIRFFSTSDIVDEGEVFTQTMAQEAEGNFTISAINYIIPNASTTYVNFCLYTEELSIGQGVPLDQNLHVIGFEPFVQSGNEPYVHHYVLHGSPLPYNASQNCDELVNTEVAYLWAPGNLPIGLPLNIGEPLGSTGYLSYRLQIHYTNFDGIENVTDNSGLRMYYTSKKREYDLGIFQIGDPDVRLIETEVNPNGGISQHSFACDGGCLEQHMTEPVTVIREVLHMHLTGISAVNYHIRDEEVIRRGLVNFFDFDQQGGVAIVQPPFQMNPGDSFRTVCNYNSTDTVIFGLASDEEMCTSYLWYYPRVITSVGVPIFCGLGGTDYGLPECDPAYNITPNFNTNEQVDRSFGGTPSSCPNLNVMMPAVAPIQSPVSSPVSTPQSTSAAESMTVSPFFIISLQVYIMTLIIFHPFN